MLEKYLEKRREKRRKRKEEKKERDVGYFREYFELITETLVYVFFVITFLLQSFVIPTGSMIDNLLIGDHLLVDKVAYSHSLSPIDAFVFPQTEIKRGMIVTFRAPHELDKEYVKRVIALPGETIKIIKQQVYIDGKPLQEEDYKRHFEKTVYSIADSRRIKEEYKEKDGEVTLFKTIISDTERIRIDERYKKEQDGSFSLVDSTSSELVEIPIPGYREANDIPINHWFGDNFPLEYRNYNPTDPHFNLRRSFREYFVETGLGLAFKVPEGHYFCMGDNRDNSLDSRFWGPVPENLITGKPWRIYWSYESSTAEYLTPGILHKIKDIFQTIINFFGRTRWSRTLKSVE